MNHRIYLMMLSQSEQLIQHLLFILLLHQIIIMFFHYSILQQTSLKNLQVQNPQN